MMRCYIFGHRYRFSYEGATMFWICERGCGAGGSKRYATTVEARRYAAAFDHEDRQELGKRAPLIAGLPLRLLHLLQERKRRLR